MILPRILAEYRAKGWPVDLRPFALNLLGLRAPSRKGGKFDDEIHAFYQDQRKQWHYHIYPATTDPSDFYLEHPYNGKYTSILAEGQYVNAYQMGLHHGKTPALVQRGPVTIVQDYDRNARFDSTNGHRITGLFGINIHPRFALDASSNIVGRASAGCQVPMHDADMAEILKLAAGHAARYGNQFTYSLLDYRAIRAKRRLGWLAFLGGGLATAAAAINPNWVLGDDDK